MNRVPVIVWNPAYIEELKPRDSLDLVSGESQIITAPASDDGATGEEVAVEPEVGDVVEEVADEPDAGDVVEEVVEEHGDEDLSHAMKDMYEFLGELSEKIQSFNNTMERSVNPGQPPAVPGNVPDIDAYDTGKAIEYEFRRFPNPTRKGMKDRLYNQVWDLLRLLQERVNQGTYDRTDVKLIEGLQVIHVVQARLSVCSEEAIEHAKRP